VATAVVQLRGGPEDKVELSYTTPPPLPAKINYQGDIYDNAHRTAKDSGGLTVHIYEYNAVESKQAVSAPRAHKGWHDVRRSVNHNWPRALAASERQTRAALRSLGRGRKVGG